MGYAFKNKKKKKTRSPNGQPSTPNKDFGRRPKWYLEVAGKKPEDKTKKRKDKC
jgi:hypothetical protein